MKYNNHKRINIFLLLTITLYSLFCIVSVTRATGVIPEMDLIASYSSTGGTPQYKDNDQDLIYKVKQGDEIIFTITPTSTSETLNYLWQVKQGSQVLASTTEKTNTYNWTVPSATSTWEIEIELTITDEVGNTKGRESVSWTITTSDLITVNPGESIQDAIDSICPEGGVVELAEGTFVINSTIWISKSNITLRGAGMNATLIDGSGGSFDKDKIYIQSTDGSVLTNVTVQDLCIKGAGTEESRGTKGIYPMDVHYLKLLSVKFEDLKQAVFLRRVQHTEIGNCEFDNYRIGIYGCDDRYGWIHNNTFSNCYDMGTGVWHNCKVTEEIYEELAGLEVTIENNTFDTGNGEAIYPYSRAYNFTIRYNQISNFRSAGIFLYTTQGHKIYGNTIYGSWGYKDGEGSGIHLDEAYDIEIYNNILFNNNKDGIQFYVVPHHSQGGGDIKIYNNVIYGNGESGIRIDRVAGENIIKNNIITNNSQYGINMVNPGSGTYTFGYNDVWGNALGNYNNTAAGTGDISKDPLFADPDNGDFHLKSRAGRWNGSAWVTDNETSPCIDAGDPSEKDPDGTRVNMGAYGGTWETSKSSESCDYYLSTQGNDSNSGTSISQAWFNLSYACNQLHAGDTLCIVDDGIYYNQKYRYLSQD